MHRSLRSLSFALVVGIAAAAALGGCASTSGPDPNFLAQIEFTERQADKERAQFDAIAGTAAKCTTDACVTQVAALAALASAGGRGGAPSVQPYRKQYHPAWGLLGTLVPSIASAAVSWHQSDTSRDVSLAQYEFLGGVVGDIAQSPALRSPSITVGGDYVPGTQHIGDAIGGDYITGHVGDAVGRDQIGGDQHIGDDVGGDQVDGDGNYNSGRIDSPGPYDNDVDNGDRCTGDDCQGDDIPPEPEPEPTPDAGG